MSGRSRSVASPKTSRNFFVVTWAKGAPGQHRKGAELLAEFLPIEAIWHMSAPGSRGITHRHSRVVAIARASSSIFATCSASSPLRDEKQPRIAQKHFSIWLRRIGRGEF
jgi:hypothetical protein